MVAPIKRVTFDGLTEGQSATIANITAGGSGDVPDSLGGSTGTGVAKAAAAIRGERGLEISAAATTSWWYSFNFAATSIASVQLGLKIDASQAAPNAGLALITIRTASGGVATLNMLSGTKALRVTDAGGGNRGDLNGGADLAPGNYWVWLCAVKGTTTADGRILATLRNADTNALITSTDVTTANTGTADLTTARFGKTGSGGDMTFWIDEAAYTIGDITEIDRPALPVVQDKWTYKRFVRLG